MFQSILKKLRSRCEDFVLRVLLREVFEDMNQHSFPRGLQLERDLQLERARGQGKVGVPQESGAEAKGSNRSKS